MKSAARRILSSSPMLRLWQLGGGTQLTLFTMHRFAVPDLGVSGHEPRQVAASLEALRRERIPILSLGQIVEALQGGPPLPTRGVIFTVDDGYFDFADVGAPIFAQYDAPVTVFLVTGFLDGACWLWWDQIRHLLSRPLPGPLRAALWRAESSWSLPADPAGLAGPICAAATRIPQLEVQALIRFLAAQSEQLLPPAPPEQYRPMTWETAKRLSREGVTFGPHTMSHPVLPCASLHSAEREIVNSWQRLREQLPEALPVFSYPNGDHGEREVALVRAAGLSAAVTTRPWYLGSLGAGTPGDAPLRIPRFPYPDQSEALLLTAAGLRRLQRRKATQ